MNLCKYPFGNRVETRTGIRILKLNKFQQLHLISKHTIVLNHFFKMIVPFT